MLKQLAGPLIGGSLRRCGLTGDFGWHQDIFQGGIVFQQMEGLKYKSELAVADLAFVELRDNGAIDLQGAAARGVEGAQDLQEGAFAFPEPAHDGHCIASVYGEVDLLKDFHVGRIVEGFADLPCPQDRGSMIGICIFSHDHSARKIAEGRSMLALTAGTMPAKSEMKAVVITTRDKASTLSSLGSVLP